LILCNVSMLIKGIFAVVGLQDFFEFTEDRYAALDSIRQTS